ncbi:PD-(D/E)XK motif protein [Actinomadura craniellae]|uniref:PD-(D/E)XK motif protein n=1 Tax=Actinomadura craniellae TaxID=2231787 RepID=UPI0013143368|nr:PD-(D/E)XK motif protein [Actinomadura craniellae]
MTERPWRDVLDVHWNRLETERPSNARRLRVSDLPVDSAKGNLAAAIDLDGFRHLLVPVDSRQKVRPGLNGPVLLLRRRSLEGIDTFQTYADLACLRADLNDLFTGLCADVLKRAEASTDNPVKALYTELDRWKSLFQAKSGPLGAEQQSGLFAELTVLVRLLERDSGAHRLWTGPEGHRHDFAAGRCAIEVKSSLSSEGRRMRIHGLDQLAPPANGTLQLAWFRLERTSGDGTGLVELAERVARLCEDESALRTRLSQAGYSSADTEAYRNVRFVVSEERWYEVNADFPKLVGNDLRAAGIPIAVSDVHYTIDITNEPPIPLDVQHMNDALSRLIEEPA